MFTLCPSPMFNYATTFKQFATQTWFLSRLWGSKRRTKIVSVASVKFEPTLCFAIAATTSVFIFDFFTAFPRTFAALAKEGHIAKCKVKVCLASKIMWRLEIGQINFALSTTFQQRIGWKRIHNNLPRINLVQRLFASLWTDNSHFHVCVKKESKQFRCTLEFKQRSADRYRRLQFCKTAFNPLANYLVPNREVCSCHLCTESQRDRGNSAQNTLDRVTSRLRTPRDLG
ncbi:MAG: hypothetical protein AAF623_05555 [Planctomycetota bacterium]